MRRVRETECMTTNTPTTRNRPVDATVTGRTFKAEMAYLRALHAAKTATDRMMQEMNR